jgi:hypothetical protein
MQLASSKLSYFENGKPTGEQANLHACKTVAQLIVNAQ